MGWHKWTISMADGSSLMSAFLHSSLTIAFGEAMDRAVKRNGVVVSVKIFIREANADEI